MDLFDRIACIDKLVMVVIHQSLSLAVELFDFSERFVLLLEHIDEGSRAVQMVEELLRVWCRRVCS